MNHTNELHPEQLLLLYCFRESLRIAKSCWSWQKSESHAGVLPPSRSNMHALHSGVKHVETTCTLVRTARDLPTLVVSFFRSATSNLLDLKIPSHNTLHFDGFVCQWGIWLLAEGEPQNHSPKKNPEHFFPPNEVFHQPSVKIGILMWYTPQKSPFPDFSWFHKKDLK